MKKVMLLRSTLEIQTWKSKEMTLIEEETLEQDIIVAIPVHVGRQDIGPVGFGLLEM